MFKSKKSLLLQKTFLIYALTLAIFVLIVSASFIWYTLDRTIKSETERYIRFNERVKEQLDTVFKELDQTAIYIASAPYMNQMNSSEQLSPTVISDFYSSTLPFNVPVSKRQQRISLINTKHEVFSVGKPIDQPVAFAHVKEGMLDEFMTGGQMDQTLFFPPAPDPFSKDEPYFPFGCIKLIKDMNNYSTLGIVMITLPSTVLQDILSSTNSQEELCLIHPDGRSIKLSPSDQSVDYAALLETFPEEREFAQSHVHLPGLPPSVYIIHKLAYSDWSLLLRVSNASMYRPQLLPLGTLFVLLLLVYFILMIFAYVMLGRATRPLTKLREQVELVTIDNPEINLDIPLQQNEIEEINLALRQMVERLQDSAIENALMKARELEASFYALQAHINPHFLFNVLSSLTASAKEEGAEQIAEPLLHLSEMLRYVTTAKPSIVTLTNEWDHVRDYLSLMKLRYEDQLSCELQIDASVSHPEQILLPRLSLQPIVENSFAHGFKQVLPPWRVWVQVYMEKSDLVIDIRDNGGGVSAAEIAELKHKIQAFMLNPSQNIENSKIGGMGLVSSLSRSNYLYKGRFQYSIHERDRSGMEGFFIQLRYQIAEEE